MSDSKSTYWLPVAIVAAFLAVAVFGIVTFLNTLAIRDSERSVARSYTIREATQQLMSAIKDTETGQRGFLLTGNESFLAPYKLGYEKAEHQFDRLRELAAEDETLESHVQKLYASFETQQAHFKTTISLRRTRPAERIGEDVLELVKSGRGQEAMQTARRLAAEIVEAESERLQKSQTMTSYLASVSQTTITVGHMIALALILAAGLAAWFDRRKRDAAEDALLKEQNELAAVLESSIEGIVTYGDDFAIRFMNPAAAAIFDVDRDQAIGRSIIDFVPKRLRALAKQKTLDFNASGELTRDFDDQPMLRSDGTEFPSEGRATRTLSEVDHFTTVKLRDLTELQTNQAKQREFTAILEQINDAVLVCNLDGHVRSCNNAGRALLGRNESELIGASATELLAANAEQWEQQRQELFRVGLVSSRAPWVSPSGRHYVLEQRRSLIRDEKGTPTGKLLFLIDITDRVREEEKDRRAQRLESIGTLAGGIAHDLNNVLTPIVMSAKLLKRGSQTPERLIENIITSADRGSRMIKKLLAFAGGDAGERMQVDLRETLAELEELLSHTLDENIDLQVRVPKKLRTVNADSTELSQVIMNLAINARDAVGSGGRIDIEVEDIRVAPSRAKRSDLLTSGPHVLLTVADDGEGIPADVIDRIFDPFFTTKPHGKGTGLGLATTLGIVRSYGGDITTYSEPGVGTKFSIYLPSSKLSAENAAAELEESAAFVGKGELILIVDDDPQILETAQEALESNQYSVVTARSGTDALAIYQHQVDEVAMVLVDMMMPGMDGFETKNAIRAIKANAKVLASSGLRRPSQQGNRLKDFDGFLAKPYTDDQLLRTVRNVLDG